MDLKPKALILISKPLDLIPKVIELLDKPAAIDRQFPGFDTQSDSVDRQAGCS